MISINKLTRDLNCLITFSDHSVTLQDWSTGQTIGIGRESQGLFHLSSPSPSTACTSMDIPLLIHNRLGHPNISKFQKMVPRFSSLSSIECESCQLGKQARASFPKRLDQRTKSPFKLVHIDIWGPSRAESILGFRYFVTSIDDYSRCTWLFLMKTRAELFSIFKKFPAEIRTQFNTFIRILRSDNAKEYLSASVSSFMSSDGILHQSSSAYTPQQNGVAERKNCHLVETACTLLLHHKVPQRFWGDAILAACYLINRMPSSILHDQIPHSIIFPNQPLFCLPPCVFGCVYFVHILTPRQDKPSTKATKCVFLGYSRLQRGYRCYSTDTNRYFISADVTFFEGSSFFSSEEDPHVSDILHVPLVLPPPDFPSPPTDAVTRPLQVYTCRPHPSTRPLADSSSMPPSSPTPILQPPDDLPIAIRKGTRSTCNPHPVYNFLSYHRLSLPYFASVSTLSYVSIRTSTSEALSHPGSKLAIVEEMDVLSSNGTWELVTFPPGKSPVGCRWVYTVKVGPEGQVDRLKACLRGILSNMAWTIMIPFLQWPRLPLFACFSLWLLCAHGPFFSWISRMSSFMVTSPRRYIWSNRLVLLLMGSLV